jgi:UDP-sulfoquinovose synthase
MKVMIMGMDGYLGWTLSMYLSNRGHEVCGIDNFSRRKTVAEVGSWSATPIKSMKKRLEAYKKASGHDQIFYKGDLTEASFVDLIIKKEKPDYNKEGKTGLHSTSR